MALAWVALHCSNIWTHMDTITYINYFAYGVHENHCTFLPMSHDYNNLAIINSTSLLNLILVAD